MLAVRPQSGLSCTSAFGSAGKWFAGQSVTVTVHRRSVARVRAGDVLSAYRARLVAAGEVLVRWRLDQGAQLAGLGADGRHSLGRRAWIEQCRSGAEHRDENGGSPGKVVWLGAASLHGVIVATVG